MLVAFASLRRGEGRGEGREWSEVLTTGWGGAKGDRQAEGGSGMGGKEG